MKQRTFIAILFGIILALSACSGEGDVLGGQTGGGATGGGAVTGPVFTGGYSGKPAVYVLAFCQDYNSSMADGSKTWIDIGVNDASALSGLGNWVLKCSTSTHVNTLLSSTEISSWSLANGDVIRIHQDGWGTTDSDKSDNNADLWDFETSSSYSINYKFGMIWLENGSGDIVDAVLYDSSNNTAGDWLEAGGDDPLSSVTAAVSASQWGGASRTDAFGAGSTTSIFARLKDWTSDGQSASDWETSSTAMNYTGETGGTTGGTGGTTGGTIIPSDYIVDGKFQPDSGDAQYSYYSSAAGKSGSALKAALNAIIKSGHTRKSYDDIWDVMDDADEWNGKVVLMYTGNLHNPGVRYPTWNREHTWPKSHGFPSSSQYGYTDAHHLRPTDCDVNSTRGNKDFDNGGSTVSGAPGCKTDSDSFEPRGLRSKGTVPG